MNPEHWLEFSPVVILMPAIFGKVSTCRTKSWKTKERKEVVAIMGMVADGGMEGRSQKAWSFFVPNLHLKEILETARQIVLIKEHKYWPSTKRVVNPYPDIQCCGSGSGIRCFFDSGSGIEKNPDPGSGLNILDLIFENLA